MKILYLMPHFDSVRDKPIVIANDDRTGWVRQVYPAFNAMSGGQDPVPVDYGPSTYVATSVFSLRNSYIQASLW